MRRTGFNYRVAKFYRFAKLESALRLKIFRMLSILAVIVLVQGCTTTSSYRAYVEASNSGGEPSGQRYVLKLGKAADGYNDLLSANTLSSDGYSNQVLGYAREALGQKGFIETNAEEDADVVIHVHYGISEDERWNNSFNRFGGFYGARYGWFGHPYAYRYGNAGFYPYNNFGPYPYTGLLDPNLRYFHPFASYHLYQPSVRYLRYFVLEAVDAKQNLVKEDSLNWKTVVTSRGLHSNIKSILPYLVVAATDYIGGDTREKKVRQVIDEESAELKRILEAPAVRVPLRKPEQKKPSPKYISYLMH